MKEISYKTLDLAMESRPFSMAVGTKANGKIVNGTEKVSSQMRMV